MVLLSRVRRFARAADRAVSLTAASSRNLWRYSGVIIDAAKGYVVTNNHVVDNATTIKVQLSDGRRFDAKVVGKDPRSDIALIQIQDPKPDGD